MKTIRLGLVISSLFFTSCSTLFNENNRNLRVTSNPQASVTYEGNNYGKTPADVDVSGYKILSGPKVSVTKKGYETVTKEIPTQFQKWTIVSFIMGIVPGIIDVVTGNALALKTNTMHVELEKK